MGFGAGSLLLDDLVTQAGLVVAMVVVLVGTTYFCFVLRKKTLDPNKWKSFKLSKKIQVSHNVVKLCFDLQTLTTILGLPIGQHVSCRGLDLEGEEVLKPYTPTTLDSDVGHFDLVVKVYSQGRMSRYLGRMKVEDTLQARGPKGRFRYTPNSMRPFGMIADSTGITPMFQLLIQVAWAILENPKDKTKIHLIYANVIADDILLKELDTFAKIHPDCFTVYYVLNEPPTGWEGGVGFDLQDMIKTHCPAHAEDIKMLWCGPPSMNKAMQAHKYALGYTKEMQFQF